MGSLVLGSFLVPVVGFLLILDDQAAFSTAHFHSLSLSASSVSQKMQRNFLFQILGDKLVSHYFVNVVLNDIKNYSKKLSFILGPS